MYYLKSDVDAAAEEIQAGGERKKRKAPDDDQKDEGVDDDVDAAAEEIQAGGGNAVHSKEVDAANQGGGRSINRAKCGTE